MAENDLSNVGFAIASDIVASMRRYNRVATGRTIREIEVVAEGESRVYILGPAHMLALEKGRGRTSASGPYIKAPISFKDSLRLWMEARGIPEGKHKDNGYGPVLWAIVTKIHKEGFKPTPGVLSGPLSNDNINEILNINLGPMADLYAQKVLDLFK